ncbi:hypothetical protein [Rhizobium johnstonii]|uniref:hypothetical protein n=1 Tax=Rhizobium johnstonii TaxID=3019933 RepID=UPI003F94AC36
MIIRDLKPSFWGNVYRAIGNNIKANLADARAEENRLLRAEHRKPENSRPRKVTYEEIMNDLATGNPGQFLDRKVQALMSVGLWPPTSSNETFDQVKDRGLDNAWTTSVTGVEHLLMVSHPYIYSTIRLEFGPYRATFTYEDSTYQVKGKSAAMAMMAIHTVMNRLRRGTPEEKADLGEWVTRLPTAANAN